MQETFNRAQRQTSLWSPELYSLGLSPLWATWALLFVAELTTVGTVVGRIGPQSGWLLPAGGLGHSLTGCMVQNVPGLVPAGWWAGWVLGWLAIVSGGIHKLVLTY